MASDHKLALSHLAELTRAVISRGGHLEIIATGGSMLPGIRPGDRILLGPLHASEPRPGQIITWAKNGRLVTHRLMELRETQMITRGDSSSADDLPIDRDEILAIVRAVRRPLIRRARSLLRAAAGAIRWPPVN